MHISVYIASVYLIIFYCIILVNKYYNYICNNKYIVILYIILNTL